MKTRQVTKWKRWTSIWCDLREKVRMATLSRRRLFDLRPGQKVLLWTRKPGKFIGWSWEGPYPVVETRGSVTTIRRNDVDFKAATTNLKPFHAYDDGDDDVCPDDVVEEPPQPDANDSPGADSPQTTTSPANAPTGDIEEHTSQLDQQPDDDRIFEIGSIRVFVDPGHRYFPYTSIAGYIVNCDENAVTIIPFVDPTNRMIEADRLVDEPAVLSSETMDIPRTTLRDIVCLKYRVPPTRNMLRQLRLAAAAV
ncbi:hypothetical protein Pmar_PMAR011806 [Perkinsus marinus ATCC 50983]|nr:hypothetical protein Pmar_PMAR011806 [Perkinsus marinus ATCC 50983]EER05759.1 hypothetical protein Pmar_PMAR011806 [Perkinsus marinus ATCC 50983]|eukprot:XP_002773943.1 hypothetical protein Pmar_PMAR011806 [Perkinsus marinus ATCC 50983]